jgi:hypothetical protein
LPISFFFGKLNAINREKNGFSHFSSYGPANPACFRPIRKLALHQQRCGVFAARALIEHGRLIKAIFIGFIQIDGYNLVIHRVGRPVLCEKMVIDARLWQEAQLRECVCPRSP